MYQFPEMINITKHTPNTIPKYWKKEDLGNSMMPN
jgi:hypothetical protein